MNDQSPPKRVTRARAAAKTTDTGMKTKVAPAAKAKITRTASTTKRKTQAEDLEEEQDDEDPLQEMNQIIEPAPARTTRGRTKRVVPPEPVEEPSEPIAKTTRGRAKKTADVSVIEPTRSLRGQAAPVSETTRSLRGKSTEASTAEPKKPLRTTTAEAPVTASARSLRGRPKKIEVSEEELADQLPKRGTRTQPTTITKTAAPKKTVKFEEPDKENIVPAPAKAKGKAKVSETASGLRAKPVRKPAAPTARATRGRPKATVDEDAEKSSPLSPKKATQVCVNKDQFSEDELATSEKTPMKPLMKSPVKPPGSIFNSAKKLDFSTSISVQRAIPSTNANLGASVLGSPARRPPQSPFKESLGSSSQKVVLGESTMRSPFKPSLPAPSAGGNSAFRASLLQSPARRPQSPTKVAENGSPSRASKMSSLVTETPKMAPFKMSKFSIPRTINRSPVRPNPTAPFSAIKAQSSITQEATKDVVEEDIPAEDPLQFSGRLSSIMPRDVDPTSIMSEEIAEEPVDQIITEKATVVDAMMLDDKENTVEPEISSKDINVETATPPETPSKFSTGTFTVPEGDDSPFHESDSEDELTTAPADLQLGPFAGFRTSSHEFESYPSTPFTPISKTPRVARTPGTAIRTSISNAQNLGFTPLARQLSDWMATSPQKSESVEDEATLTIEEPSSESADKASSSVAPSPMKSTYFDDEMSVRDELAQEPEPEAVEEDILEENFSPTELDEEDLDLANEADEMSLLEPEEIEAIQAAEEELDAEKTLHFEDFEAIAASHQAVESDNVTFEEAQTIEGIGADAKVSEDLDIEAVQVVDHEAQLIEAAPTEPSQMVEPEDIAATEEIPEASVTIEFEQTQIFTESNVPAEDSEIAPSEASQEYGDENDMPIDPALLALTLPVMPTIISKTPKRVLMERVCHTVSKVPLKPAADETPMRPSPKKRSASISRLPAERPSASLKRNNTVISYSPKKGSPRAQPQQDTTMQDACATPSKDSTALWSTLGTPPRTPRRDVDTSLLKGAVVFVDVYTTEGADASVLFTELLTQMGARCVKQWNWNCSEGSKIGITHVVYKDGGKRTLEKVREGQGVVSCVGVGWVLDCERENKWLDEAPYVVDTSVIPRGGHRRRKSMEPKALVNFNGTLSSSTTPGRKSNASPMKGVLDMEAPHTAKSKRRESIQWVRSPSTPEDELADQTLMLSPIPATPAPETISAYGEEGLYGDDTPVGQTPYFLHKEQLIQKTAPPAKGRFFGTPSGNGSSGRIGEGFLSEKKDESVMMRLMAARRKSLQFAPKIGSPLARAQGF